MMRSKNIWGEDAEIFRPERWLEADETQLKLMNSVVELNFGSGKYQCLGKTIAFMELNKIFVEVSTQDQINLMHTLMNLPASETL